MTQSAGFCVYEIGVSLRAEWAKNRKTFKTKMLMGQEHQTYLFWYSLTFWDVILICDNPNIRATLSLEQLLEECQGKAHQIREVEKQTI